MPKFSQTSEEQLSTCVDQIQSVMRDAIKVVDFKVLEGYRSPTRQNHLYRIGRSQNRGGESVHNSMPSCGVDVAPCPIDWSDTDRFIYLAGIIKGIAHGLGVSIRWGGDWDGDGILSDNKFNDLGHFEIGGAHGMERSR